MMAVQKEMGKGFNLQTAQAGRVYTILEILFKFMFVKVTWLNKSLPGKKVQINGITYVVSWFSSRSTNF